MSFSWLYGKHVTAVSSALTTAIHKCTVAAAAYLLFSCDMEKSFIRLVLCKDWEKEFK